MRKDEFQPMDDEEFRRYKRQCITRLTVQGVVYLILGLAAGFLLKG